jgi:hypothetical protein
LALSQEHPDRLDLWKFFRLKSEIEKTVQIFTCSFSEEYAFYLSNRRSFYSGDDRPPTQIFFLGFSAQLYKKAILIPDIYLAYLPSHHCLKKVVRISQEQIPIYALERSGARMLYHLVEFKDLNLWIAYDQNLAIHSPYSSWDLLTCFSYWMLQLCNAIPQFSELQPKTIEFFIVVHHSKKELVKLIIDAKFTYISTYAKVLRL